MAKKDFDKDVANAGTSDHSTEGIIISLMDKDGQRKRLLTVSVIMAAKGAVVLREV